MSAIEFMDPPPDGRRRRYDAAVAALRARPNEWARIASAMKSHALAANIRRGNLSAFSPAESFETTARKTPEGAYDIYARYVGEAQS